MTLSKTYYIKSGGVAYNLDVGFVCDRVDIKNLTQWETDTKNVKHHWNKYMTDEYSYSEVCEDNNLNRVILTTDGFTPYATEAFTDNQATITGATQASPCVLTVTTHGFGDAGDEVTVRVRDVVGMTELNGNMYKAIIVDANSVYLKTMIGDNLNSIGFTAYTSGGILYGLSLVVEDEGFAGMTLGTGIVGANDDILEVVCWQDNFYTNLGDIA